MISGMHTPRITLSLLLFAAAASTALEVQHAPLQETTPLRAAPAVDATIVWVQFRDKGDVLFKPVDPQRQRRLLQRGSIPTWTYADAEPRANHVDALRKVGARVRAVSRWFNAASVEADPAALARIHALPFVHRIAPVRRASRHRPPPPVEAAPAAEPRATGLLDYGPSMGQLAMLQVPAMHDTGLRGQGIRIGVLDSGFNRAEHPALATRTVLDEWDFVDNDGDTSGPVSYSFHGTQVLSVLAGYAPGQLIGPAFEAELLLARTESVAVEAPFEEDLFVAGLEWCEARGAEIVSASLGYADWLAPDDYDGNTSVSARGCEMAAARGVVIVTAAGNGGPTAPSLVTPADARGVLAVGALLANETIAPFSSRGPTADGRVKPDVMGQGVGVRAVNTSSPGAYLTGAGTSYATPLVAGALALLLQARPALTAEQVRILARATASRAAAPDTDYGWGTVRILDASNTEVPADFPMPDLDYDDDYLRNHLESWPGTGAITNERLPDSDGDGLLDGREDANRDGVHQATTETNPLHRDSDGDRWEDGIETRMLSSSPRDPAAPGALPDADRDGLPAGVDPDDSARDSDGDRYDDGYEAAVLGLVAATHAAQRPSLGDLNEDGQISNLDALIAQSLFMRLTPPERVAAAHADPTRDGAVSNADALVLHAYFLANLATLPPRLP